MERQEFLQAKISGLEQNGAPECSAGHVQEQPLFLHPTYTNYSFLMDINDLITAYERVRSD